MFLQTVIILAKQCLPDELSDFVAFHLGLHWMPKWLFTGIQATKGIEKDFNRKACQNFDVFN